jgi:serpin B
MKPKIIFLLALVPFFLAGSCQKETVPQGFVDIPLDQTSKSLLQADKLFSFDLLKAIEQAEDDQTNYMVSPLSVTLALAMTLNGADGTTKDAMEEVLHVKGLSTEDINKSYEKLIVALLSVDPEVVMEIANSIWYRNTFTVLDDFLDINQTYFNAEVSALDFTDPNSKTQINQWVSDKTHQKIKEIVNEIDPNDIMFLINAIYFKGTWTYQFDEQMTSDRPFYRTDGSMLGEVPTMKIKGDFKYTGNDVFEALELPYGTGNYSMLVMLPAEGYSCDDLVLELDQASWDATLNSLYERTDLDVYLPKFKFEYEKELKDILEDLGMGVAFTTNANFTKIHPSAPLAITAVKHKTFVEVNEEGTEAAAVTSVTVSLTSVQPANEFRADRPFVFAIRENSTGAIMFMGKVANPSE